MLTPIERDVISPLLLRVVSVEPSPRQALAAFMDLPLSSQLEEGSAAFLVERALVLAQNDAFRRTPPAIIRLLTGLLPDQPEITAIADRLSAPPPVAADPFDALVLRSNLPFLERNPTRQALKSFLREQRPNKWIVVINGEQSPGNGEETPGKTHTSAYVDHVLSDQPSAAHCLVKIVKDQGASVGPLELARDMVTNMGGEPTGAPPANSNQQRWVQEVVNWVLSIANKSPYSWWFILDGFNANEMRSDTGTFIETMATKLGTGIQRDRHRLILLDFNRTVLAVTPGSVSDQTTSPIPHDSVAKAVVQILATSPPELDRALVIADVLEGLSDPIADLRELGVRLGAVIETHGAAT